MAIIDKQRLCEAFCGDIEVSDVPSGIAVRTGFLTTEGDAIGFYVTRNPQDQDQFRLEDSGLVVPILEASGVNLDSGTRAEAFRRLLQEHGAQFDEDSRELQSEYVTENDLPSEAMRFMALMLRIQDLELLNPDIVESTFRQDAEKVLREKFESKAKLDFQKPPAANLRDFEADAIITSGSKVVAVYFGTTDSRVDEAVLLWMESHYNLRNNVNVVLLLENPKPAHISNRSLRRAMNRLDGTAVFREDEVGAMTRIATMVGIDGHA